MTTYRKGELFCGLGGLSLGSKQAVVIDDNGQVVLDENGEEYKVVHAWAMITTKTQSRLFSRISLKEMTTLNLVSSAM